MADPKILCVPVDSSVVTQKASVRVRTARQVARALLLKKTKQLTKARGRLARVGGVPPEVSAGIQFRNQQGISKTLTSPYEVIDFSKINDGFFPIAGYDKLKTDFINEIYGKYTSASAAVFFEYSNNVSSITAHVANTSNGLVPSWLGATTLNNISGEDVSGAWLIYKLRAGVSNNNATFMSIRYGTSKADFRKAQKDKFSLKSIKPTTPLRIIFDRAHTPLFRGKNQHEFFELPTGVSGIPADKVKIVNLPANLIATSQVTLKNDQARPYGPEYNSIRPPGTPSDFEYAMFAEGTSIRNVLSHYNSILSQAYTEIKSNVNPNDSDKFNHYYPSPGTAFLPSGLFTRQSRKFWEKTAALSTGVFEVRGLTFDMRPNNGQPVSSVLDPGPFDETRGLLVDGSKLVEQATRPNNVKFDNRFGSMVIVHDDEIITDNANNAPAPFNDASRMQTIKNNKMRGLEKLEAVCQLRLMCIKNLFYRPYTDYVTIAAFYRYELGLFLFNSYVDDRDNMMNTLTSQQINANIPNNIYQETWGSLALRSGMGTLYETIDKLPKFFGTDEFPSNADRLLPFSIPSDPSKISAFGDLADVNIGQASYLNYADPNVPQFIIGQHGMFRSGKIRKIVIHWGGTRRGYGIDDGGAIAAMFSRTEHVASTHLTLTHDGLNVRQHADLIMATYHAQGHNDSSIGIDLPNIGYIARNYASSVKAGYESIGYTSVVAPVLQNKVLMIGDAQLYETMYLLIKTLIGLNTPPPTFHTDNFNIDAKPVGVFVDSDGNTCVITNKLSDSESVSGVCGHIHVTKGSKVDGIDGYVYYALRSHLNDTADQAFRRMKLTLASPAKTDDKGRRYLVLDRS